MKWKKEGKGDGGSGSGELLGSDERGSADLMGIGGGSSGADELSDEEEETGRTLTDIKEPITT